MNFGAMATSELKSYIRRHDDLQEEACLELCTRHDAGDLIEFFHELKFRPENVNEFIKRARNLNIPSQLVGAVVGKSERTVRRVVHNVPTSGHNGRSPDKTDMVQRQASINVEPEVWEQFKKQSWDSGKSAAETLGSYVSKTVEDSPHLSIRNYDRTVACDIEPATELIDDVKMLLQRLTSPVYTLSNTDKQALRTILETTLKELNK